MVKMKIFCPECIEEMNKIKQIAGDKVNVFHYECRPCGIDIRVEE